MSQATHPPSRLRRALIWSLVASVLVGGIWIAVILWWQFSQRLITLEDVVVYLVVLPVAVLILIMLVQWLRHKKRQAKIGSPATALADSAASNDNEHAPEPTLPIISAWAVTSVADNAADFLQALLEKRQRPRPDTNLQDDYGFPLHTGRVNNLDTDFIEEELTRIAAAHPEGMPCVEQCQPAFIRSVALLSQVLDQLSAEWPLTLELENAMPSQAGIGMLRGQETISGAIDQGLQLQVKLLVPEGLSAAERRLAQACLAEKIAMLVAESQLSQIELVPAADDATILLLAERFRKEALTATRPQALLLLAGESTLCTSITEQWQNAGRLFGAQNLSGMMPGEAAFAILCVNDKAVPLSCLAPACHLSSVSSSKRETSADSVAKPASTTLIEAVSRVLAKTGIDGETIGAVACDADHRTSRVLECIGAMMHHTPQLDAVSNRLAVNEACGHMGSASLAGGLVAGIVQARDSAYPVLLFNVCHLVDRAAALLIPASDQPQPS